MSVLLLISSFLNHILVYLSFSLRFIKNKMQKNVFLKYLSFKQISTIFKKAGICWGQQLLLLEKVRDMLFVLGNLMNETFWIFEKRDCLDLSLVH